MTTFYLLILFMLPAVMAVGIAIPRRRELSAQWIGELVIATALLVLGAMLALCRLPVGTVIVSPVVGLSFTFGGFQRLYGLVVCFMWLICAMLSPQYFRGHRHLRRYYFFFLICLSFTLGVFLSADLKTTFLFFELMSLGSYVWVVQEETPEALEAGKTYLTIAVLGGLVTLMGLFLLQHLTGTLVLSELKDACAAVTDRTALWWAALCVFFGFAAKAGVFPLHIWLPKAHPVAPAPASALLSGVLTKAGIFGILIVTVYLLPGSRSWGVLVLILGCITMVLGAVMAAFSTNLKYILACSSLSQIGFILVGVAMLTLLGEHNALAAHGTVLYMLNHSLVKLTLFLFAGVVYYNTHQLDLNRIRGFGRGKPLLHGLFLCGACSLAGIPGFLGYQQNAGPRGCGRAGGGDRQLLHHGGGVAVPAVRRIDGGLSHQDLCGGILAEGPGRCPRRLPALGNAPLRGGADAGSDTAADAGSAAPWAVGEARRRYPLLHRRS